MRKPVAVLNPALATYWWQQICLIVPDWYAYDIFPVTMQFIQKLLGLGPE